MGDASTSHFDILLPVDENNQIQFAGWLLVCAGDIAILVLNFLVQKGFAFLALFQNWSTLELYMLIAPLIVQLLQPAFILAAHLLS